MASTRSGKAADIALGAPPAVVGLLSRVWSILHSMETIQVVLDKALLRATDLAARKRRLNRSALVREALGEHLKRLAAREREQRDREGYRRHPTSPEEFGAWDTVAAWPDE